MQNQITNPHYFFSSNGKSSAVFTVSNSNKNQHHTFKILLKFNQYMVYKLTGPDFYTYIATIRNPKTPVVKHTEGSKVPAGDVCLKVVQWGIDQVIDGKTLPEGYAIQGNGKCGRCGKPLTTPESINRGIGPKCAQVMGIA